MLTRRSLLTALLAGAAGPAAAGMSPVFALLSPEELSRRQPGAATRGLVALRSDGPGIEVAAPASDRVTSPVSFDVRFTARGGAAPDMGSLKVEYRLGPFWKDVTRRLLGAARIEGTRLRAAGAQLPAGEHVLRLRIRDSAGRETVTRIELTVTG